MLERPRDHTPNHLPRIRQQGESAGRCSGAISTLHRRASRPASLKTTRGKTRRPLCAARKHKKTGPRVACRYPPRVSILPAMAILARPACTCWRGGPDPHRAGWPSCVLRQRSTQLGHAAGPRRWATPLSQRSTQLGQGRRGLAGPRETWGVATRRRRAWGACAASGRRVSRPASFSASLTCIGPEVDQGLIRCLRRTGLIRVAHSGVPALRRRPAACITWRDVPRHPATPPRHATPPRNATLASSIRAALCLHSHVPGESAFACAARVCIRMQTLARPRQTVQVRLSRAPGGGGGEFRLCKADYPLRV